MKNTYPRTQRLLLGIQLLGDALVAFVGLSLTFWLRFRTPIRNFGVESGPISYSVYLRLILLGTLFYVATFAYLKLYDGRLFLRPHRALSIVVQAVAFWLAAFLGTSLVLKFEPSISRLFVILSCFTTLVVMAMWRMAFFVCLSRSSLYERIVQRVLFIGWNVQAEKIAAAISVDKNHPYKILGYLSTGGIEDPRTLHSCTCLGSLEELEYIARTRLIDIALVADANLGAEGQLTVSTICERLYIQFKIVPSLFQIFASHLHLQTISGVPVLGVEELRHSTLINSIFKRLLDVAGALVGLVLSLPIIAILALLIKKESPGPILYKQVRTGRQGQPFNIFKLRSMRLDAEKNSGACWAVEGDPRRLKIGAFMREWNLDELPQFWNVLLGDMSLVGPRPERPELIAQFEKQIPHYNPRHEVRPGITGWAQVNGLRGNTSLVDRIRFDLYYIENWSLWFDIQILLLTFFRRKNAY